MPTADEGTPEVVPPASTEIESSSQASTVDAPDANANTLREENISRQRALHRKRRLKRMHRVLANLGAQKSVGKPPTKLLQQSSSLEQYARLSEVEEEFLIKKTFQSRPQSTELNKSSKLAEYIRSRAGPQFERGRVMVHTVKERQRIAEKAYYDRLFDGSFHNGTLTLEQIVAHSRRTRRENAVLARRELEKEERQKRLSRDAPDFSSKQGEEGDSADTALALSLKSTGNQMNDKHMPVDLTTTAATRKKQNIAVATPGGTQSLHGEDAGDKSASLAQKKQSDYLDYLDARLCGVDTGDRYASSGAHPYTQAQYARSRYRSGSHSNSPSAQAQLSNPRLKKKIAAKKIEEEKMKSRLKGPKLHRATFEAEMSNSNNGAGFFFPETDSSRRSTVFITERGTSSTEPRATARLRNPKSASERTSLFPADERQQNRTSLFLADERQQNRTPSGSIMSRPPFAQHKRRSHTGGTFAGRVFRRVQPSASLPQGSPNGGFVCGRERVARPTMARPATASSSRARRPMLTQEKGHDANQSSRTRSERPQTAGMTGRRTFHEKECSRGERSSPVVLRRASTRTSVRASSRAGVNQPPRHHSKPLAATFVARAKRAAKPSSRHPCLANSNMSDGPSPREIQARVQVEHDLKRLMAYFANKIDSKPSAFISNLDALVDPLAMMDDEVEDGDDIEAGKDGGADMFHQLFSVSGVAAKVMKFAQKLKRKALIASYKKRRMLTKEEYEALRQKSKEFFTDEDGDQVRIDEDMVSMLLDYLETMRPGEGDSGRKKALSRVLLEKARELLEHHDSVAVYAIQQFADNSMMLKLFLRYRLRVDDERRRIVKRRESMAQISSVFKVRSPITAAGKFAASLSSPHTKGDASPDDSRREEDEVRSSGDQSVGLPVGYKASPPRESTSSPKAPSLPRKKLNKGTRRAVAGLLGREQTLVSDIDSGEEEEVQLKKSKWHAIVRSRLNEISASYVPEVET